MSDAAKIQSCAPVVVFAYNRPLHLSKTIQVLSECDLASQTPVIVYLDGPRDKFDEEKQSEIRHFLLSVQGFFSFDVRDRDENVGLTRNVTSGVTEVMQQYGRAIILEDDILVSKNFLNYMNDALEFYADKPAVWHISAWNFPINDDDLPSTFLWRAAIGWGWATWQDRWQHYTRQPKKLLESWNQKQIQEFNLYGSYDFWEQVKKNVKGEIHTWAVFWYATIFQHNGLCLSPSRALTSNIGFDGSGTHNASEEFRQEYDSSFDYRKFSFPEVLDEDYKVVGRIISFNQKIQQNRWAGLLRTNDALKVLLSKIVSNQFDISLYKRKNCFVFGTGQLSRLIAQLLKSKNINVVAFVVTNLKNSHQVDGISVESLFNVKKLKPEVIINAIEGLHDIDVGHSILKEIPDVEVVSWRDL